MAPPADALQRQTKRYERKRQAILDAAVRLFNQKGVKGTTLADVAQSVGLITNSVTYYYRKKEELATACLLRSIEALEEIIARAVREPTLEARIRTVLRLYVAKLAASNSADEPPLMSFSDMRALTTPHVELVFDTYTNMFRRLREVFRDGSGHALSRPEENARTHLLISLMNGARVWIDHYEPEDYARDRRPDRRYPAAWPGGSGLGLVARAPAADRVAVRRRGFARSLPAFGDDPHQRAGLSRRVGREDLGPAECDEGLLLSSQRQQGRPRRRLFRPYLRGGAPGPARCGNHRANRLGPALHGGRRTRPLPALRTGAAPAEFGFQRPSRGSQARDEAHHGPARTAFRGASSSRAWWTARSVRSIPPSPRASSTAW